MQPQHVTVPSYDGQIAPSCCRRTRAPDAEEGIRGGEPGEERGAIVGGDRERPVVYAGSAAMVSAVMEANAPQSAIADILGHTQQTLCLTLQKPDKARPRVRAFAVQVATSRLHSLAHRAKGRSKRRKQTVAQRGSVGQMEWRWRHHLRAAPLRKCAFVKRRRQGSPWELGGQVIQWWAILGRCLCLWSTCPCVSIGNTIN